MVLILGRSSRQWSAVDLICVKVCLCNRHVAQTHQNWVVDSVVWLARHGMPLLLLLHRLGQCTAISCQMLAADIALPLLQWWQLEFLWIAQSPAMCMMHGHSR
jgi:hypothetical protein